MQHALAGAESIEVLDTKPDIKDKPGARKVGRLSGELTFENVSFSYEGTCLFGKYKLSGRRRSDDCPGKADRCRKTTISALIARFTMPIRGASQWTALI